MKDRDLIDALGSIIRNAEDRRFEPGFSHRVMERIRAETEVPVIVLSGALRRQFLRLVPIAAAVLVALSAYSLLGLGTSSVNCLKIVWFVVSGAKVFAEPARSKATPIKIVFFIIFNS